MNGFAWRGEMVPNSLISINLDNLHWRDLSGALPADLAETHFAAEMAGGRHVYLVSGQVGEAAC